MIIVGTALVWLGVLVIWIEPTWVPRFLRRFLPHAGIAILGFIAIDDRLVIAHLDYAVYSAPDSALRTIAPEVANLAPRTLATLLPPDFFGTERTVALALMAGVAFAIGFTTLAFTRRELVRSTKKGADKVVFSLCVLSAAWFTGMERRALDVVKSRIEADGGAPVRSIGAILDAVPATYRAAFVTTLVLCAVGLFLEWFKYLIPRLPSSENAVEIPLGGSDR